MVCESGVVSKCSMYLLLSSRNPSSRGSSFLILYDPSSFTSVGLHISDHDANNCEIQLGQLGRHNGRCLDMGTDNDPDD
jgi:hypothetical protein